MHNTVKPFLFVWFVMMLLSCSPSLPNNEPYLGKDIDMSQLNTMIKVTEQNSSDPNKFGEPVELEIVNLSNQVLEFRINEIQMFRVENNHWQTVAYKTQTLIVDDFVLDPSEINNETSLLLEPYGVFPGYKRFIDVIPDMESNKPILIRIFVLAHDQELNNIASAFVDVYMTP